ncbi:hypothetical protein ACHAW5_007478 [Stephanodiscus triporus]|uniref:Holocytochrome c-type synthase n=1 Tax=Stephanodiscus triporus TaxID=2934178 RepID=A0ABD3PZ30_9STRA
MTTNRRRTGRRGRGAGCRCLAPLLLQQQRRLYDVYSRPLPVDPTNGMPLSNPDAIARNSLPAPNQSSPLPTERVSSTIPKGGEGDGTWTYPSPQMFYNALVRKGKVDEDTREEDMTSVHRLFGHLLPFNRHDWMVLRTSLVDRSSRDVQYVIDYYHDDIVANAEIGSCMPALDVDVGPGGGL